MMFKQKFAKNLKALRKLRKLTQEQLAEIVGVDFRYISLIENAKSFPSCELIEKLSSALKVDYSDLFSFDENMDREVLEQNCINLLKTLDTKSLKTIYNIAKHF